MSDLEQWPQRCSGFEAAEQSQGDISLNDNYYCLDPINGCNFLRRMLIIVIVLSRERGIALD